MRDQFSTMATVAAVTPDIYSASPAAIQVNRSGFDAVTFAVMMGVGGITFTSANRIDFILEHSDDGTTWEPVANDNVLGFNVDASGVVISQRTAHATPTVRRFAYVDATRGDRRLVRLRAVFVGTHGTGTAISALAILGLAREMPVAA